MNMADAVGITIIVCILIVGIAITVFAFTQEATAREFEKKLIESGHAEWKVDQNGKVYFYLKKWPNTVEK